MEGKKEEMIYKIILLGSIDSGKTRFIRRYADNIDDSNILTSKGQNYKTKRVILNGGERAIIQIYDTASDKLFKNAILGSYAKEVNGFIIMYNRTWRESFEIAKNWLRDLKEVKDTNNIALVENYLDEEDCIDYHERSEISREEGQKFAVDNNLLFFVTSHNTGININECFDALINRIYENDPNISKNQNKIQLKLNQNTIRKKGCLK